MKKTNLLMIVTFLCLAAGCATVPKSPEGKNVLSAETRETLALFKEKDPGIQKFFDRSYGYAVLRQGSCVFGRKTRVKPSIMSAMGLGIGVFGLKNAVGR
ncbi:MAG: hypothetical protein ACYSTJ_03660 [Planctomycetota bacterium]|jgi:hypothetical protein